MIGRVSQEIVRSSCLSVSKEGEYYRVVWSKSIPQSGWELCNECVTENKNKNTVENNSRFESSISRTKSLVRQYARCNDWDYFVTLTISPENWDRFDLKEFYKSFGKYLNNKNNRRKDGEKLVYMLIPEQHKNGAWHFHGLMKGIPKEDMGVNKNGYWDWPAVSKNTVFVPFLLFATMMRYRYI